MPPPGRNDPCPCGSGKKYKRCCLAREEQAGRVTAGEADARESAVSRLIDFALSPELEEAVAEAMDVFFDGRLEEMPEAQAAAFLALPQVQQNFNTWFALDFRLPDGRTLVDLFLERQGARLPAEARARLGRVQRSHIALYEVEAVEPDEGLTLVDAWTGERLAVRERLATRQLVRFDVLAARCTREPEGHWIIEGDVYPFSPDLKGEILRVLKQRYRTFRRREPGADVAAFLKREGVLFNDLWLDWMVLVPPPRIVTVEGDDVAPSRVVFDVRDREALLAALDRHADLDREADLPAPVWIWTEPGEEPRRTLGSIRFKGRRLVLETMSRPRAERGRGMIEGVAGGAIRYRAMEIEELDQAMKAASKRPRREPDLPPEEAREILQAFYDQHYRSWVDEPLPILGGRTPREAARLKTWRPRVIDLLKSLERDQAHAARQGEPAYDVGWIWEELGLPRP